MKIALGLFVLAIAPIAPIVPGALCAQTTGLSFDHGVDEHVDVPYDPLVAPQTGLTVEAWIRYDETLVPTGTFRWPTVCRQDVTPGMESYFLRVGAADTGNRNLEFAVRTSGGLRFATYAFAPGELGVWSHVAGTYDGSFLRLYLNGVEVGSSVGTGQPLLDTGGVLRIGNGDTSSPGAETWSGDIDELRVWPFARLAGEILQTRGDMLAAVPGGVLTFNLESHFQDTSSGLVGTATGTPTFVTTPALVLIPPSVFAYGTSTTLCAPLRSAVGSKPIVPFPDFTIRCVNAPPSAGGFFLVALGQATIPILGVSVQVDLAQLIILSPTASDALGLGTVPIGIGADPTLVGVTAFTQFVFADSTCGVPGFVGSDALSVTIL